MNTIYKMIMSWLLGDAMAHSDRIKTAVYGSIVSALVLVAGQCSVCNAILTPDVTKLIAGIIATCTVSIIAALSHRDVGAPGQWVPGAAQDDPAIPAAALPPPPPVVAQP